MHDLYASSRGTPTPQALLGAIPRAHDETERLVTIPGNVPVPGNVADWLPLRAAMPVPRRGV